MFRAGIPPKYSLLDMLLIYIMDFKLICGDCFVSHIIIVDIPCERHTKI